MRFPLRRFLAPVVAGALLLAAWQLIHQSLSPDKQYLLPTPSQVGAAFAENHHLLFQSALITAAGAALGLLAAIVVGYALALALAFSKITRAALYPYLMVLQMTPIIVFAPILVLVIDDSLVRVSIITFLICFFPLVVNTAQGLLSIEQSLLDLFRLSKASRVDEFLRLRMPAAQPYFFTGLRIAATLAPIGAIVGDYTAGNAQGGVGGLGFQIVLTSSRFQMPQLYATALTGCALGFLFVAAVIACQWLALHRWHDSYDRADR
jgi:NitT/TauT family transport system permease protein